MKQLKSALIVATLFTAAHSAQAQPTFNQVPSRIIGQPVLQQTTLTAIAPNLVEGRELNNPQAVAVDTSASPPIVYVADTSNNRVLAWKNAAAFSNGAMADKVIGQRDFLTTFAKGPGTDLSTGLNSPLALLVDKSGNLYVADGGNNRVVRYPAPFSQTSELLAIDLIIGQHDNNGRLANEGQAAPSEKTLAFSSGGNLSRTGLAFDNFGNLWIADPLNNRILRFPASALAPQAGNEPSADLVLGQSDFASRGQPVGAHRNDKNFLSSPSGIAFDPQGRLYVPDFQNRVLVFVPPFTSGALAARIMGVILPTQQQPNPPSINDTTLGSATGSGVHPPEGVFFVGNNPFVVDTGNARILKFDPFDSWPAETATVISPKAIAVTGQPDFLSNRSNRGQPEPSNQSLSGPVLAHANFEAAGAVAAAVAGNDLYVVDAGNNRVLVFPQQAGATFTTANRVLGQLDFRFNAPNLIEGREFFFQNVGGGVVIDARSDPPHLYVSDPGNNRVLGFKDFRTVKPGDRADLVIGQPDFFTAMFNYPKNDPTQLNDQGLVFPEGIALDANSDLWVADTGNGRVLRFPRPFDQPAGVQARANLVVGQPNFFTRIPDASSQTMGQPYGIAFSVTGHLLVSDSGFNRVLLFLKPAGGDFVNGQSATRVIGQPDFGPHATGSLLNPAMIAIDLDDRLYVADSGNHRLVIYDYSIPSIPSNDPAISLSFTAANSGQALAAPTGVVVNQLTSEIWVTDSSGNRVLRFPRFDRANTVADVAISSAGPLAVALDPFGNPVVVENINRVAFYYPQIDLTSSAGGVANRFSGNAANYFQRFAPAMIASIFAYSTSHFGTDMASASTVPLPTVLGDVSVFVAGVPAPLFYASPSQINFQVPSSTPVGSTPQEIQVVKASTGQIIASSQVRIDPVSPGLFTRDSTGTGPLAVLNQDNTVNSGTNPAKAGSVIQIFGTGMGIVSGAPPDGTPAPNQQLPTDVKPQVFINAGPVPDSDVLYSGLAPGFVGVWQINVRVPKDAPIGDVAVAVVYKGFNSRADQSGATRATTIRTTP
jgi:uncharacterized protein (TIGR03437 family)